MKTRRITLRLEPTQHDTLTRLAVEWETSPAALARRAVRLMLADPEVVPDTFDPAEWKPERRGTSIHAWADGWAHWDVMRHKHHTRRAHRITCDERTLWILPVDQVSGQKVSRIISEALAEVEGTCLDPLQYVAGWLHCVGADRLYWRDDV